VVGAVVGSVVGAVVGSVVGAAVGSVVGTVAGSGEVTQPHSKRPSTRVRIRIFFIFIFLSRKSGKLYQISPENARGNPWKNTQAAIIG
jgi:hypothetical protein